MSIPLAGLLALTLTRAAVTATPTDVLTAEIVVELRSVTDVGMDPAGEHAAYVLTVPRSADDEPGTAYSEIWVTPLDGGPGRRYTKTASRSTSPRWSPDGMRVAFLARSGDGSVDDDEDTQIHVIRIDGGAADPLTSHDTSVTRFRWSPDGKSIAFAAADDDSGEKDEAKETGRDWVVVGADDAYERLWIVDIETRATHSVYEDALNVAAFEWRPDGREIVFVAAATPDIDDGMMGSRIHRVAIDGGAAPAEVMTRTAGKLGDVRPSPDGRTVAFLGATRLNDPLPQSVMVTPWDGSEPRNLTADAERSSTQVEWAGGHTLMQLANEGTGTAIALVDTHDGTRRVVVERAMQGARPIVSRITPRGPSGQYCALAHAADHPSELFVGAIDSGALTRLTHHNPVLETLTLARAQTITWTASDGRRIEGVVTYPVSTPDSTPDGPAPLVVHPHGGPEGVTQDGWNSMAQLLAARGYVVLQPNYRGSGGRGVAFSQGDHDDLGGQEFQDILAGVDDLVGRGVVDPERVGMGGWSYGGYLSAMAATHHSDRFRAAVMGAGISNWLSFTGTTDIPDEMSTVHWNLPMEDNVPLYWERSPLSAIEKARTPTLILFGADDDRVPPSQGHELHYALKTRGVDTEMVLYPRAAHGVRERAHRIDLLERQLDWFDRYLAE